MSDTAFVLGNGESRKGIQIEDLKKHGSVFACNAVYRTDRPNFLVAVDPKMMLEIAESDYMIHNQVWSNFNNQYEKNQKILIQEEVLKNWPKVAVKNRAAANHAFSTFP